MPDFVEVLKDTIGSFLQERAFQKRSASLMKLGLTWRGLADLFVGHTKEAELSHL